MPGRGFELKGARAQRADYVALALVWLLALGAPELLGGVFPWGMLSIAATAVIALATALWAARRRLPAPSLLDAAMLLAFAFTALQALPLPCAWIAAVAPEAALELGRAHSLLGLPAPSTCVLSRDPGGTREEIVKGVAILAAYGAARVLVQRGKRAEVVLAVAASGTLLAGVTLAHVASGATEVFGTYAPIDVHSHAVVGPVLNPNALGGLLALCVPILVAQALSAERGPARVVLLLAMLVVTGTLLLTRSRGAVGALALGLLALGALTLWARRGHGRSAGATPHGERLARLAMPLAIVTGVAAAALGSYAELAREFQAGGLDKLQLIARSASSVTEHRWLGIGRGAFASAFARVHQGPTRFDHPENLVVQWASEWGLPIALVLLLAIARALFLGARRGESWERRGALAGVLALGAQNMVDLGLELVGIAVLGALALACATSGRESLAADSPWGSALARAGALVLAGAIVVLANPLLRDHLPYADRELRTLLAHEDSAAFRARLRSALTAHPGAPVLAVLGASEALRRDQADALAFINHSQALAPGWALPHLFAAQWLWNHAHRAQALLELSIAARVDLRGSRGLTCAIAIRDPDAIVGIAPKTADPELFLELAQECVGRESPAGLELDEGLARLRPDAPGPWLRSLTRLFGRGLAAEVLTKLRSAPATLRNSQEALELEVRSLLALQRSEEALAVLKRAASSQPPSAVVSLEVEVLTARKDSAGLRQALERARGLAAGAPELAAAYRREARAWLALDRHATALAAFEQAYRITGEPGVLREIARISDELGDRGRARHAHARLCELDPGDQSSCQAGRRPTPSP